MKKIILMIAAIIILFGINMLSANAADIIASGSCGDYVTCTLDDDGILTITGRGEMNDYNYLSFPWNNYRKEIKTISS